MQLTNAEISVLRGQPQRTNLWLSIYRPRTAMVARVATGTYALGDQQIAYYNVTGSYSGLYPDLTVLVGSQEGSGDAGRIRLRAITGSYAQFAENAIQWQEGQYLTFLDYVTPEAVYPRIIQDPSNSENVIFYKDYDIPYTNQNSLYGTFPCAGPHRAGFLLSGTASFYFTATGTYNVAGQSLTYSWNFDGGTPTGSSSLSPGTVTWNTAGHYKTRLRVTAANGAVDDTYRYISVYDRPGVGPNTPTLKWELQELSGSRDAGGYTASFKLYENIGEVEPNALVVIFSETWYNGTKQSLGGNAPGNSSIVFVGYILNDTIKFDYRQSYVEFDVGSISEAMKAAEGFSVSCESKASPATWFELQEMTVPKAMYHYLRWHSTVLKVTDFQYTGDDRLVQYFDADRGSLYDAVDSFMRDGMIGAVIADRQGKLWAEINSYGLETPFSTLLKRFTVHKQDWIGSPTIRERRNSDLSFIELGGIAFYGVSSNAFSALLSNAPSTVPLYHGRSERNDGLILVSQQQLNRVAGNYLAHFNTKFPDVTLSLAGNYNNFDITPLEMVDFVIDQNDSVRGKSIQDLRYYVNNMEWNYDSENEVFRPEVTFNQVATGTIGVTVEIPAVPPDGGYGYPAIDLPPLPDFSGGSTPVGSTVNTIVVLHDTVFGVIYTENFDSSNPQWFTMNMGLTNTQYTSIDWLIVCPNGALYCGVTGRASADIFIARSPGVGQPWTMIETYATIAAKYPATIISAGNATFHPSYPERVAYIVGSDDDKHAYVGAGTSFTQGYHFTNIRNGDYRVAYGETVLKVAGIKPEFPSGRAHYWHVSLAGTSLIREGDLPGDPNTFSFFPGGISKIDYLGRYSFQGMYRYVNDLQDANPTYLSDDVSATNGLGVDNTGMYLMGQWDVGNKGRSSDGGTTWTALPTLPPNSSYQFCYAGTGLRWIAVGQGAVIRFSPDFGQTWLNREGNITTIASIPSINMVRVYGTPLK